jgi:hypothetical protein
LAKCLALGMDANGLFLQFFIISFFKNSSAVQKHRDQIGPRKRDRNSTEMERMQGGEAEEEEPMEMKPRLLRSSTEETEPHIQVVDHHQNIGTNLLPPLTLMGTLAQKKPKEEVNDEDNVKR